MTYRAVVKYPVTATPKEKSRVLEEGIVDCTRELMDLEIDPTDALEEAKTVYEWEKDGPE